MSDLRSVPESLPSRFHAVPLLLVALAGLLFVFWFSDWYAGQVSLPRYCNQSELMLRHLATINTTNQPAGDNSRRDFIIAAKLEFLLPRRANESLQAYIDRLNVQLSERCR